jgi:hypothetical protein
MKYYIYIIAFLFSVNLQGKTLVLKINNPKPHIQVVFKDTVIWRGEGNNVKVRVSGKYKLKRVGLKGGEVSMPGGYYRLFIKEGYQANLLVFLEAPNGKVVLGYQRLMKVVDRERPIVTMSSVASDSVIQKTAVIKCSQLRGKLVSGRWAKIKSFEMKISDGEKMVTYKSTNDALTLPMRNAVRKHVKHGSIIRFTNIRWISEEKVNKKLEDLLLFVNDNKTK